MKKIFTFLVAFTVSTLIYAQLPQNFSYQAIVRSANNALLSNQKVGIKISLLKGTENGQSVYSEVHTATTNANGLVSIAVGGGTFLEGNFIKIDWANGPYFVKSEVDPEGGTNYSLVTTTLLSSVPYALYAANSQPGPKGDKGEKGDQGKDGKVEFQNLRVSAKGDTLFLTNGNFVIIPGLSAANTTTKPTSGYGPTIKDVEGNEYKTVYIGTQQWMGENLKTSKYSDETLIPNVTDNTQWSSNTTGAWCYYNNDALNNDKYGKLYNWYAVSPTTNGNKNVCPTGWHVPTDGEWTILTDYLGGPAESGNQLRTQSDLWIFPKDKSTNITLFTALPGGLRNNGGDFNDEGSIGMFWNSNSYDAVNAYFLYLLNSKNGPNLCSLCSYNGPKAQGLSIRCVKD